MKIDFDIVRIGKFRKDSLKERIIKENVDILKHQIRSLLEDIKFKGKYDEMGLTLVIPSKGADIKISIEDRPDENVRYILNQNFPNSIYKGDYSVILDNAHNTEFPSWLFLNNNA